MPNSVPIDFWFSIGSMYTFLTVMRIDRVEDTTDIRFVWRPFSVRDIMIEMDNRPMSKPKKLAYMWRDVERRARRYGIPFVSIPNYPNDADELANRVATLAALEGWCPQFAKAAYAEWFIENRDPGKVECLSQILQRMNRSPQETIDRANSQATNQP